MKQYDSFLFVGGQMHGKRIELKSGINHIQFANCPDNISALASDLTEPITIRKITYTRRTVYVETGNKYIFFGHSDCTTAELIERLIISASE